MPKKCQKGAKIRAKKRIFSEPEKMKKIHDDHLQEGMSQGPEGCTWRRHVGPTGHSWPPLQCP
jgi:hypothetical protein